MSRSTPAAFKIEVEPDISETCRAGVFLVRSVRRRRGKRRLGRAEAAGGGRLLERPGLAGPSASPSRHRLL